MSDKHSRAGGKYSDNHTTLIPAAATACDIAHACRDVTRISPGFIKAGLRPVGGNRRIKITKDGSAILLSVRDNVAHQEVYVYANNVQAAMLAIACGIRNANLHVSFSKEEK